MISQIEFLVFPSLSQADRQIFERFIQRVEVIGLSVDDLVLVERIIVIRQQYRLKLPDAIIAAITIENSASLVTADREFIKVRALTLINFN